MAGENASVNNTQPFRQFHQHQRTINTSSQEDTEDAQVVDDGSTAKRAGAHSQLAFCRNPAVDDALV